ERKRGLTPHSGAREHDARAGDAATGMPTGGTGWAGCRLAGRPTTHREANEMSEFRRASPISPWRDSLESPASAVTHGLSRARGWCFRGRACGGCADAPECCLPATTEVVGSI